MLLLCVGTAAGRSVVSSQLGIFFLGDDHNVYWLNGYTPKNISTDAQSKELTGYADLSDAYGFYDEYRRSLVLCADIADSKTHVCL